MVPIGYNSLMKPRRTWPILLIAPFLMGAINLKLEVELPNDQHHLSQVEVEPEKWVNVNHPPLHMRLKATPQENNTVAVEFQIHESRQGKKVLVGAPSIVTYMDRPAELAARKPDNSLLYRLKVTAENP